jgi:hypothetical protein
VLLEALRGKADRNGDGIITLDEVMAYLAERIPQIHGVQRPVALRTDSTPLTLPLAGVNNPFANGRSAAGPFLSPRPIR